MVSFKHLEGECTFVKLNTSLEQSKCPLVSLRGIRTNLYRFGLPVKSNGSCHDFSCTDDAAEEGQSLLDALLLAEWEDSSWKGQLKYDVTACETKIINGGKNLIAQLSEKWNSNFLLEFENSALQPLGTSKPSYLKTLRDSLLFCVASGEKEISELIPSTNLPKDGTLISINVNPVEYGHVFLVPYDISQRPQFLDKRMLKTIAQITAEINNCSFRIFYDHNASTRTNHIYFQAAYFANALPVELLPTSPVYGGVGNEGLHIHEVADYPLKALMFRSKNLDSLVGTVANICYSLQQDNTVFNLLFSDCGTKIFLFPQAHLAAVGSHLSTWECGGYFIYNTRSEFDHASEVDISKRMASASLDDKGFQALKQLCCRIAAKLIDDNGMEPMLT